jgi:hypothetical protein
VTVTIGNSGAILALGNITPGSGGNAPGTYNSVPLTGGAGTMATANITVSAAGTVTAVALVTPGINYALNDTLSAAASKLGGVSGFSIPVTAVSSPVATLDTQRHVICTSGGNDSGITFSIGGTNDSGQYITDSFAGANVGRCAVEPRFQDRDVGDPYGIRGRHAHDRHKRRRLHPMVGASLPGDDVQRPDRRHRSGRQDRQLRLPVHLRPSVQYAGRRRVCLPIAPPVLNNLAVTGDGSVAAIRLCVSSGGSGTTASSRHNRQLIVSNHIACNEKFAWTLA